jgi:hypothetical protein
MVIDRYTKGVLTVIAGCLLWICVMGAGRTVSAQGSTIDILPFKNSVQPVIVVGTGSMDQTGRIAVNFVGPQERRRTDPTVPVTLPYSEANPLPSRLFYTPKAPMPVEISAVRKTGEWEPMRVAVEDAPLRRKPGIGQ